MATWEDGPEYAPLERPDQFDPPEISPLDEAPPRVTTMLDAPKDRPEFGLPDAPVPELHQLSAAPADDDRDPGVPFAVASATITEGTSAWSAAHWSPPSGPPVEPGQWAPPTGSPASATGPVGLGTGQRPKTGPPPTLPITLSGGHSLSGSDGAALAMPQPGTNEWFAPGTTSQSPAPGWFSVSTALTAFSPVVLIFLLIGCLVQPMAAVAFIVAFSTTSLVKVARALVRRVFIVATAVIVVGTLSAVATGAGFFGAFNLMAQISSWGVLLASVVLVLRALRQGETPTTQQVEWA